MSVKEEVIEKVMAVEHPEEKQSEKHVSDDSKNFFSRLKRKYRLMIIFVFFLSLILLIMIFPFVLVIILQNL